MRKILYLILIVQLFFPPFVLSAENEKGIDSLAATTNEQQLASVNVLLNRIDEIKSMEMNSLSSSEKKELRKEIHSIKAQLKEQKKAAVNGPVGSLMWIIIGAGLGVIVTLLFLLGAFN